MHSSSSSIKNAFKVVITDTKNYNYAMQEHFCEVELADKINRSQAKNALKEKELKQDKEKLQENHLKINYVKQFKKFMNLETKIVEKLKVAEDNQAPGISEKIENMASELNQLRSPLQLKNFSHLDASKKNVILQDLKEISVTLEQIDVLIRNIMVDNDVNLLSQIANQLNELDDIVHRCELEVEELDSYVLRSVASKIGLKFSNP